MLEKNCTFCKIAKGNIPARIISQNDNAAAFLDAFPLSVGHTLIVPKKHYSKVQDMNREDSSGTFELLRVITGAVEKAAGVRASTIAIHNGIEAGQVILHVHIHIIPRFSGMEQDQSIRCLRTGQTLTLRRWIQCLTG